MMKRRTVPVISAVLIAACAGAGSLASADPQSELASAVLSAHGASGCPPLQSDPLVTRVAQMANQETTDYINHRTAAVPFSPVGGAGNAN